MTDRLGETTAQPITQVPEEEARKHWLYFVLPEPFQLPYDQPANQDAFDQMQQAVNSLTEPDPKARLDNDQLGEFCVSLLRGYVQHPLLGGTDTGYYGLTGKKRSQEVVGKYILFRSPRVISRNWASLEPSVSSVFQAAVRHVIDSSISHKIAKKHNGK